MATWGPTAVAADADDACEKCRGEVGAYVYLTGIDTDGWAIGSHSAEYCDVGLRFANVTIPKNAIINSAYLTVYRRYKGGSPSSPIEATLYGEDTDNAAQFTTDIGSVYLRTKTTANIAFNCSITGIPGSQQSGDIKTIIQEIVNRDGWASGQALALIWWATNQATGGYVQCEDYGTTAIEAERATLVIDYTEAGGTTYYQSADGVFAPTGLLLKNTKTVKAGNLMMTGIITKKGFVPKAGIVTFSGAVLKKGFLTLSGVFSTTGALGATLLKLKSIGGILSFSGSVGNVFTKIKALTGSLSFSGSVSKLTSINLAGILTFTGNIGKTIKKAIAGMISFVGDGIGKLLGHSPQEIISVSGEFIQLVSLPGEFTQIVETKGEITQLMNLSGDLLED